MSKLLEVLKGEPIRLRLYAGAILVAMYLLAKGVISADDVEFIIGIVGLVLAVETARAKVTPVAKL